MLTHVQMTKNLSIETIVPLSGVDPEILKRGGGSMLANEENFRFEVVLKGQNNIRNLSFWQNISISVSKFFPILYTKKAC